MIEQTFQQAMGCHQRGELAEAERLYRAVLAQRPNEAGCLGNLGKLLADQGRIEEGIAAYEQALRAAPQVAALHYNLGMALRARGDWAAAEAAYRRAVTLQPGMVQAHNNLGNVLQAQGRLEEAVAAYQEGLRRAPNDALLHNNLGNAHKSAGRLAEAVACYRRALELGPGFAEAWINLGDAHFLGGDVAKALECGGEAEGLDPGNPVLASNVLVWRMFDPAGSARQQYKELALWRERFADPLKGEIRPHGNGREAERRLRVGYVSGDFREHVIGRNVLPMVRGHDRERFEVFCYSTVAVPDGMTAEFEQAAGTYRAVARLSHAMLAEQIRADGIDILVDLSLHLAGNRLLTFARKPAPVQVTFAGYPGSTGLETMDYRLTDGHLDPPDLDGRYVEKSVRLPASFWCYAPEADVPEVGALPARANGYVTFGCLNNFSKVNAGVLALWERVLAGVAGARLVLLADEGSHRERTWQALEALGVARERVRFVRKCGRRAYLELYQEIDISLDTVPYNGHTTSLDSLFMGVPVVTQAGSTVVGRAGVSQLMNLGLPELIGRTPGEYVHIARGLAGDLGRLEALRAGLRGRMRASALMDAAGFVRGVEAAYREMWRTWCAAGAVHEGSGA